MARAEICPVCSGTGVYPKPDPNNKTQAESRTCHGCQGKGWVSIEDSYSDCPACPQYHRYPYYLSFMTKS